MNWLGVVVYIPSRGRNSGYVVLLCIFSWQYHGYQLELVNNVGSRQLYFSDDFFSLILVIEMGNAVTRCRSLIGP
jgi:hypothetical protein